MSGRKQWVRDAVLSAGALAIAAVLRYQWVSGFANNADADAVRFLTGALLSLFGIVPLTFLVLAIIRR